MDYFFSPNQTSFKISSFHLKMPFFPALWTSNLKIAAPLASTLHAQLIAKTRGTSLHVLCTLLLHTLSHTLSPGLSCPVSRVSRASLLCVVLGIISIGITWELVGNAKP